MGGSDVRCCGAVESHNLHDVKTRLSQIVERVERTGVRVVIMRSGWPVADVEPPNRRTGRGSLKGVITLSDDWDPTVINDAIAGDFGIMP